MVKYVLLKETGNIGLTQAITHTKHISIFLLALREIRIVRFLTFHF
jgi:hypothetical protein